MKIKKVNLPTKLSEVDPKDDNIDVIVTLEDNNTYVLVVATPQNLFKLMNSNDTEYLPAGSPIAFVKELTLSNISSLVESFSEGDAYWLKYYHNASEDH
jgi:hypothetical protein